MAQEPIKVYENTYIMQPSEQQRCVQPPRSLPARVSMEGLPCAGRRARARAKKKSGGAP